MAVIAGPNLQLPWSSSEQDNKRYRRILGILAIPFLIFSIIVPLVHVPEPDRKELEKLPPQLAKVVLQKKELPKPPPPPPKEEKKPELAQTEVKKTEPKKVEPKPIKVEQKNVAPTTAKVQKAQEQAKQSGVLQFADDLAEMRDALDVSDVKTTSTNVTRSKGDAATVERSFITSNATAKSGGVNTAALSRDTGGTALSGKETTAVASKLEEVSAAAQETRAQASAQTKSYRGDQTIRQKMDEAKGRIFGIYNRALRQNPTLQGTVTFKLVIEPSGAVSSAQIVSSALKDADLERKLLAAVRSINFGASDVLQTTLNYSFDFLPY